MSWVHYLETLHEITIKQYVIYSYIFQDTADKIRSFFRRLKVYIDYIKSVQFFFGTIQSSS